MSANLDMLISLTYQRILPVYLRHAADLHPAETHAAALRDVADRCERDSNRLWHNETARNIAANAANWYLPKDPRSGPCEPQHRGAHAAARAAYYAAAWLDQAAKGYGMIRWGTPPERVVRYTEAALDPSYFGEGPDVLAQEAVEQLQPALTATFAEIRAAAGL